MKIFQVKGVKGNFGDELNGWMWERLAPELFSIEGDALFVGIGTIFDSHLPPAKTRVIFGSGAGYGRLPQHVTEANGWRIYGVRGKLTAKVLDLSPQVAATDPAILLSTFDDLRAAKSDKTIFIPHWKTMRFGEWEAVCNACQIKLVDPRQDSKTVIKEISGARKVIAESMHAAIIADCFRVPWVPVTLSREVSAFKWRDWGSSVGVPYQPRCIPASSPVEAWRDKLLSRMNPGSIKNYPDLKAQRAGALLDFSDEEILIRDFMQSIGTEEKSSQASMEQFAEISINRIAALEKLLTSRLPAMRGHSFDDASAAMRLAIADTGWLSDDRDHANALADVSSRLEAVRRDHRAGLFDRGTQTPS